MSQPQPSANDRLASIAAEFAELEPRERLELLLEYAESLPPLPAKYQAESERAAHRVRECQTPVFLWVELEGERVRVFADAAPESPTVRGFVSLLIASLDGAPATEVQGIEPNLVHRLGLVEALGMVRMRGLQAILFNLRKQVAVRLAG